MVANPLTNSEQTLLVTGENDEQYWESYGSSRLGEMTVEGSMIWQSPALIGSPRSYSMHARKSAQGNLEVMMATARAMYWLGRPQ